MRFWQFGMIILMLTQCEMKREAQEVGEKLKLLILSGSNNHEWEKTTPLLVKIYEASGRFSSVVTERPDTLILDDFTQFDVVVSNYTPWPIHEFRWPQAAAEGLMKFIENGGGFVLFHAASAAFYEWEAFQEMVGTTWGDSTAHGKITPHKIVIKDKEHPITKGISDFWITDELWVNSGVNSELNVLAESYSEPSNSGRGIMEPVVHWNSKRKGRVFHNILGHHSRAMKNTGWKTLMLRGTEWAATGKVSIAIPASLSNKSKKKSIKYSWTETDTTCALLNNDEIVWQYNFKTIKGKPFFHPVNIENSTISWLSPEDHPWHLGIWHSWKYINGVNYWEYDLSEGVKPFDFLGITEVRDIQIEKGKNFSCKFYLQLAYHEKAGQDLMAEKRIIEVSSPDQDGLYYIDYLFDFESKTDSLELNRTPLKHEPYGQSWGGYAGLSVRFNLDLFEPSFINPDGSSDMNYGAKMAWKYYGLRNLQGESLGVAIFDHPKNLNHPTPWFVTNTEDHPFYYFSPAPIFYGPYLMMKGDQLKFKYRIQFYADGADYERLYRDYGTFLKIE